MAELLYSATLIQARYRGFFTRWRSASKASRQVKSRALGCDGGATFGFAFLSAEPFRASHLEAKRAVVVPTFPAEMVAQHTNNESTNAAGGDDKWVHSSRSALVGY